MTLHSFFLRLLCRFGLCAWLSIQSAGSPSVRAGNSDGASAKPVAHFTDIAQKAGLTAPVIFGGENTKKYIIETTGTGVAIFDYDNDGWPDTFVVNGTKLEGLPSGKAPTSHLSCAGRAAFLHVERCSGHVWPARIALGEKYSLPQSWQRRV